MISLDELRQMAQNLSDSERQAIFNAAQAMGEAMGRRLQVVEMIARLEADGDETDDAE